MVRDGYISYPIKALHVFWCFMNFFADSKYGACCMKQDVESRVMSTHLNATNMEICTWAIIWLESQLFEDACFVDLCLVHATKTRILNSTDFWYKQLNPAKKE